MHTDNRGQGERGKGSKLTMQRRLEGQWQRNGWQEGGDRATPTDPGMQEGGDRGTNTDNG